MFNNMKKKKSHLRKMVCIVFGEILLWAIITTWNYISMIFNRIYSDIIDKPIDQQAPVISREKAIYSQRKGNKY